MFPSLCPNIHGCSQQLSLRRRSKKWTDLSDITRDTPRNPNHDFNSWFGISCFGSFVWKSDVFMKGRWQNHWLQPKHYLHYDIIYAIQHTGGIRKYGQSHLVSSNLLACLVELLTRRRYEAWWPLLHQPMAYDPSIQDTFKSNVYQCNYGMSRPFPTLDSFLRIWNLHPLPLPPTKRYSHIIYIYIYVYK